MEHAGIFHCYDSLPFIKKNNQVPVDSPNGAFTDGNNFQQSKICYWRAKGPIGVGFKNKRGNMDEL